MSGKTVQPPVHINDGCLKKALEAFHKKLVEIRKVDYKPTGGNGENFCSNNFLATVTYEIGKEEKQRSFFLKDVIQDSGNPGVSEFVMYNEVLPALQEILEGKSPGLKDDQISEEISNRLAPRCYLSSRGDDHEFYILDDLNAENFEMGNRIDGLPESDIYKVLTKLAKFHAASMIYAEKHPQMKEEHSPVESYSEANCGHEWKFVNEGILYHTADLVEQQGEDFKELADKMRRLIPKYDEKIRHVVDPANCRFSVLNHGDLWANNLLFQRGSQNDAIFVDFQNVFWSSPAYDINFFLFTSLPLSTLQRGRFEFLHFYYRALKSALEEFSGDVKVDVPTWSDFRQEVIRCSMISFYAVIRELPMCCMTPEMTKEFVVGTSDDLPQQVESRCKIFENERALDTLIYAMQHLEEVGLFEEEGNN